jgi:hypothetical protein
VPLQQHLLQLLLPLLPLPLPAGSSPIGVHEDPHDSGQLSHKTRGLVQLRMQKLHKQRMQQKEQAQHQQEAEEESE